MTADTRGFCYPLAAARQRASHTLDAAVYALQSTDAQLRQARSAQSEIESRQQTLLVHGRASAQRGLVPEQSIVLAHHLAALETRRAQHSIDVRQCERRQHAAMAVVARRKAELEAFDRDRSTCLKSFVALRSRQEQARLDQDWLARRSVEACR